MFTGEVGQCLLCECCLGDAACLGCVRQVPQSHLLHQQPSIYQAITSPGCMSFFVLWAVDCLYAITALVRSLQVAHNSIACAAELPILLLFMSPGGRTVQDSSMWPRQSASEGTSGCSGSRISTTSSAAAAALRGHSGSCDSTPGCRRGRDATDAASLQWKTRSMAAQLSTPYLRQAVQHHARVLHAAVRQALIDVLVVQLDGDAGSQRCSGTHAVGASAHNTVASQTRSAWVRKETPWLAEAPRVALLGIFNNLCVWVCQSPYLHNCNAGLCLIACVGSCAWVE